MYLQLMIRQKGEKVASLVFCSTNVCLACNVASHLVSQLFSMESFEQYTSSLHMVRSDERRGCMATESDVAHSKIEPYVYFVPRTKETATIRL